MCIEKSVYANATACNQCSLLHFSLLDPSLVAGLFLPEKTTDISRRHTGFSAGRVASLYLFLRLGCLTFVFCFVMFVGLFVVIVFFFGKGEISCQMLSAIV